MTQAPNDGLSLSVRGPRVRQRSRALGGLFSQASALAILRQASSADLDARDQSGIIPVVCQDVAIADVPA
jgi:hypothetical protein